MSPARLPVVESAPLATAGPARRRRWWLGLGAGLLLTGSGAGWALWRRQQRHPFATAPPEDVCIVAPPTPYDRASDNSLRWDDPALAIDWPLADASLSAKDAAAPLLAEIALERLPQYLA